jgi:hypothetical protein
VEPTNNEAERLLRAGVIWRKTSFGSNSGRGMRMIERLLTVAETSRKQGRDLPDYLTAAVRALGWAKLRLLCYPPRERLRSGTESLGSISTSGARRRGGQRRGG